VIGEWISVHWGEQKTSHRSLKQQKRGVLKIDSRRNESEGDLVKKRRNKKAGRQACSEDRKLN